MTTTLADIKAEARTRAFAARKVAHDSGEDAGAALSERLLGAGFHHGAKVIAGYRPIRTEIDPTPLMTALHRAGYRMTVPVIRAEAQPLAFHEWWPDAPMTTGAFGAEIPVDAHVLIPDLLLVPLLAFDRAGYRLGYGGGFYDRSLELLKGQRPVLAIGVAYAGQEVDSVPTEITDQRLDAIVTEHEVIRP